MCNAIRKNVSGRFLIGIDANLVRLVQFFDFCAPDASAPMPPSGSMCSAFVAALMPDVIVGLVLWCFSQGLNVLSTINSARHHHSWHAGLQALCLLYSATINESESTNLSTKVMGNMKDIDRKSFISERSGVSRCLASDQYSFTDLSHKHEHLRPMIILAKFTSEQ